MSKLSRRSLVANTAALPALTVPAVASALPTGADVELQQLGVRLLAINRRIAKLEADPNSSDEDWEEPLNDQAKVVAEILRHTATSVGGVAVQTVDGEARRSLGADRCGFNQRHRLTKTVFLSRQVGGNATQSLDDGREPLGSARRQQASNSLLRGPDTSWLEW